MDPGLTDRRVLVTGSTRGMGRAMARPVNGAARRAEGGLIRPIV